MSSSPFRVFVLPLVFQICYMWQPVVNIFQVFIRFIDVTIFSLITTENPLITVFSSNSLRRFHDYNIKS